MERVIEGGIGVIDGVIDWSLEQLRDAFENFPPIPITLNIAQEQAAALERVVHKESGGTNQMRVQLQRTSTGGVTTTFASQPVGPKINPVTKYELRSALWLLYIQARTSKFPWSAGKSALTEAIVRTSEWIGGIVGGVAVGGNVHSEILIMPGNYRVDVENLRGHNLLT
jgi:hypothetical protein